MNNEVNYTDKEEVTKWEVIDNLTKEITKAEGEVAFFKDKIKTGGAVMGDPTARLAQAEAEAKTAKELLNQIISIGK